MQWSLLCTYKRCMLRNINRNINGEVITHKHCYDDLDILCRTVFICILCTVVEFFYDDFYLYVFTSFYNQTKPNKNFWQIFLSCKI